MDNLFVNIVGFIIAAAIILVSGARLTKYGDIMAGMLGWSKMFMGLLLISFVTSLPELMTGVSSIVFIDAPDLAVGDIVGSCAFNILIISIMDLFYDKKKPLTSVAQIGHVIAAAFGIIMLCLVALGIVMPTIFGNIAWVGGFSFVFLALYLVAIRVVFLYERKRPHSISTDEQHSHSLTLKQVIFKYITNAVFVMLAALLLPYFGEHIAIKTQIDQSFFGTVFLAFSTSLPEIVVSVAAIRMGTIDLAIGNIFGSNIFNIGILALDDLFYTKGPIFLFTNPNHIIPVLGTIIITAIGIIGIVFREEKKWKLALDSAVIVIVFVLMTVLLYLKNQTII